MNTFLVKRFLERHMLSKRGILKNFLGWWQCPICWWEYVLLRTLCYMQSISKIVSACQLSLRPNQHLFLLSFCYWSQHSPILDKLTPVGFLSFPDEEMCIKSRRTSAFPLFCPPSWFGGEHYGLLLLQCVLHYWHLLPTSQSQKTGHFSHSPTASSSPNLWTLLPKYLARQSNVTSFENI